jgi:hypothetical protein
MLLMALTIVSCKRRELQSFPMITSNLVSDVKSKTGTDLPKSCRLIVNTNYSRLNSDVWLFAIDPSNRPQFPGEMDPMPQGDGRKAASVMEDMGGISIGVPKALYFGIWQVSNAQCHATLLTTSNSDYLMLERLY